MISRPSLATLIARVKGDLKVGLPGSDPFLRHSVLGVLARMQAGLAHLLYGSLEWVAEQVMPDTADSEHLDRWASIWSISRKESTSASGPVQFTGADGSTVPAGSVLQDGSGQQYTLDADADIAGGVATGTVTAAVPGTSGNIDAGASLTLTQPVAGVDSQAVVDAGGLTGGTETESDDALRDRLLAYIRRAPHGGAFFDYENWALEVAGVTRVWVYPNHLGIGTVGITFVTDDAEPSIIPDAAKVSEVQAYIDDPSRKPVTAQVTVFAPTAVPLDMTIQIDPNTQAVRDAIAAQLEDLIYREGEPGATIYLSRLREAISLAAGESNHVVISPAADVAHQSNEIPVLGVLNFEDIA